MVLAKKTNANLLTFDRQMETLFNNAGKAKG